MPCLRSVLVQLPILVACVIPAITPMVRCSEPADVNTLIATLGLSDTSASNVARAVQDLSEGTTDVRRAAAACAISRTVFGNRTGSMVDTYIDSTATNYFNRIDVNWYILSRIAYRESNFLDACPGLIRAGSMPHASSHPAQ